MKRLSRRHTKFLQTILTAMTDAEKTRCDSDARDEYEQVAVVLASYLVIYGAESLQRPNLLNDNLTQGES